MEEHGYLKLLELHRIIVTLLVKFKKIVTMIDRL